MNLMSGRSQAKRMATSKQISSNFRWVAICAWALSAGCPPVLVAGEEGFELYYSSYRDIEDGAEIQRDLHGDVSYALSLFNWHAMANLESLYETFGAHPELAPPDRTPEADDLPVSIMLDAAREFIHTHYLDLWCAAYTLAEIGPEREQTSEKEDTPFADLAEGEVGPVATESTGRTRSHPQWRRDQIAYFYSEDLFLQKRVEQLARLHGNDDSELVAGLTGRQIIAYMREHLPEPDPRVLTGGAVPAAKRSIVDPANRFSDGVAGTVVADGSADSRTSPNLWPLIALLLMACAWGFIFVRRARR